ncbi:DUF547 domain-containing protein [Gaetbulibacter sp. M235]|uniref:DUF547 domain-containing protein n=1 Tax=Gaetbulibacter sp. M235 TaxID=3126510 RepID=UPI00374EABE8
MMKVFVSIFFILLSFTIQSQNFDHAIWNSILKEYVSSDGHVNYKAIKENHDKLDKYLLALSKTTPDERWSKNETLAYWINAYNAFTVKLIIDNYPLKSIKDIENPWDINFITIGGETLSLNHIEHNILRKMEEPRIHFAIVCASVSCPKLQNEALIASKLDVQLSYAAKEFLSDNTKNDISEKHLYLSKIFQWFPKDFKKNGDLIAFLNQYSQINISKDAKVKFKDYNWNLNE